MAPTKTLPTIPRTQRRTVAARTWLAAKGVFDAAEFAVKEARLALLRVCPAEGVLRVGVRQVVIQSQHRREFDVDVLRAQVSPAVFAAVTKPKVDVDRFDAFVLTGRIPAEVVEAVVTVNEVPTVVAREAE